MGQGPQPNPIRQDAGVPAVRETSSRRRIFRLLLVVFGVVAAASAAMVIFAVHGTEEDGLDRVHHRGTLIWGADQEGGGPYVYPRPEGPKQVTGFEVDLMNLLAESLGVRAQFQQCEWTNLPDLLRVGDIDCITNGYELTEAHLASKIATIPYYVYELQLVARRDDARITSWESLVGPGTRKTVGVLKGSAAETFVRNKLGERVEIVGYQGATDTLQDVVNGRLDATVQDLPPLIFYKARFSQLHFVDAPVGRGYYVIYLRPGEERLRDELNSGLRDLIRGGQLRAVYERYGLWNTAQEQLGTDPGIQQSIQARGWQVITENLPILLQSAGITVLLAVLSMPLAICIGLIVALGRLYGPSVIRLPLAVYVEVLRGTPLLLQLYTIFFVLPAVGVRISAFPAAVLGLAINYSAYEAEIYRAGLQAIPITQLEAALALGLSRRQALRRIIIPQAMRLVIPPVTNDFVALFKDTSICSVITIVELTKRYNILANSTGAYLQLAILTAILYLLMSYPLSLLARRLEGRVHRQVL